MTTARKKTSPTSAPPPPRSERRAVWPAIAASAADHGAAPSASVAAGVDRQVAVGGGHRPGRRRQDAPRSAGRASPRRRRRAPSPARRAARAAAATRGAARARRGASGRPRGRRRAGRRGGRGRPASSAASSSPVPPQSRRQKSRFSRDRQRRLQGVEMAEIVAPTPTCPPPARGSSRTVPGRRAEQPGDDAEQRRLAGAVRPGDRQHLAGRRREKPRPVNTVRPPRSAARPSPLRRMPRRSAAAFSTVSIRCSGIARQALQNPLQPTPLHPCRLEPVHEIHYKAAQPAPSRSLRRTAPRHRDRGQVAHVTSPIARQLQEPQDPHRRRQDLRLLQPCRGREERPCRASPACPSR